MGFCEGWGVGRGNLFGEVRRGKIDGVGVDGVGVDGVGVNFPFFFFSFFAFPCRVCILPCVFCLFFFSPVFPSFYLFVALPFFLLGSFLGEGGSACLPVFHINFLFFFAFRIFHRFSSFKKT